MAADNAPPLELLPPEPAICVKGGHGPLLPIFGDSEQEWPRGLRVFLYLTGLLYLFLGVSIISDTFMIAIEKVTSKRIRRFDKAKGRWYTYDVWNATVANLSLMALGSSAPEILLSVIDIFTKEYFAEGLGPGTIVGSAAYNLLMIIAVCVISIPDGQVRKVKDMTVYICTASWSIFAYLWLIFILVLVTPNVVDIWEGVLTFLFFPILLAMAWACDKGYIGRKDRSVVKVHEDMTPDELAEAYAAIRKERGMSLTEDQAARILMAMSAKTQSRAKYRVNACRGLTGGKRLRMPFASTFGTLKLTKIAPIDEPIPDDQIEFRLPLTMYAVLESAGEVPIKITRAGDVSVAAEVYYRTVAGTATAQSDFQHVEGWLRFEADEVEKIVKVAIIDDASCEDDEVFYFQLTEAKAEGGTLVRINESYSEAAITIIDDDEAGVLSFCTPDNKDTITINSRNEDYVALIKVQRRQGSCGEVRVRYHTESGSALDGRDFEGAEGQLVMAARQLEAVIQVTIKAVPRYDTADTFRVLLTSPEGGAKLDRKRDGGLERNVLTAIIEADRKSKESIDRLRKIMLTNWDKSKVGHSNWRSRFAEAVRVNGGGDDDDDEASASPSLKDYITHIIALPWKLLFAFVPPPDYCGGWLCFFCSLIGIGIVTMLINDIASLLGCVMCLPDELTAITFVAMGTSLPDTFASIVAAKGEPYADSSIGNVTGSNSVNVFLGLGLPWMIAAFAWHGSADNLRWQSRYQFNYVDELTATLGPPGQRKQAFVVLAGSLAFSVVIFTICAVICIVIMALRRKAFGGELGGPKCSKWATFFILFALWFFYIGLSAWKAFEQGGGCPA